MNWYKKAQFKYDVDEERTTISSPYGSVVITESYPRYEFLKEISRRNLSYVYLNASPTGFDGLTLGDLTKFYEKFGFKVIKDQGGNNLMGINKI